MPYNQETGQWEAKEGCCQEQADLPGLQVYFPCNKPADGKLYRHKFTGEGPYRFCERHAFHSVRNRNFEEVPADVSDT